MKEVLFEHRKQMYIISNICDTIPLYVLPKSSVVVVIVMVASFESKF